MDTERIKEIQSKTAYPDSISVQQALFQVWNECTQEKSNSEIPGVVLSMSSPMSQELRKLVDEWKKDHKGLFELNPIDSAIDYAFEESQKSIDRGHRALMIDFACQAYDIKYRSDDSFRAVAEELYDKIYNSESKEV